MTYTIQAAEVNAQFQFLFTDEIAGTPISLSSNPTITVAITNPSGVKITKPCAVSGDMTMATYSTDGTTDFPTSGTYKIQAIYVGGLGTHRGPQMTVKVLPNL